MNKYTSPLLNDTIQVKTLGNGLTVAFLRKYGFRQQIATYSTRYGSIDNHFIMPGGAETTVPDGIAHFLEHKMFESQDEPVFDKFSRLGSYCNAFTSYDCTSYMFISTSKFYENLDVLLSFVNDLYLTPENVEKEKAIIEQEIKMYEDEPEMRKTVGLFECLYKNHPIRLNPAGSPESVWSITVDMIQNCYKTFYHPANMVLFAAADIDADEFFNYAEKWFEKRRVSPQPEIKRIFKNEPEKVYIKYKEEHRNIPRSLYSYGFKWVPYSGTPEEKAHRYAVESLALECFFGKMSPIYKDLYKSGLVNEQFIPGYETSENMCTAAGSCFTESPELVESKVAKYVRGLKRRTFTQEDLDTAKRLYVGKHIGTFDTLFELAFTVNTEIMRKSVPLMSFDEIQKVTLDEILEARNRLFSESIRSAFVLKPAQEA